MSDHATTPRGEFDLEALRDRLENTEGKLYWRSLEELAGDEDFERYLNSEFPEPAALFETGVSRRSFLKVMGASMALAGLSACTRQPKEKIFPYVKPPEEIVPGEPLYFATAFEQAGEVLGVLAESHHGRPTKIEGNPDHPASLGATDTFAQAYVLGLYDPDRSQVITEGGQIRPWSAVEELAAEKSAQFESNGGAGLRILSRTVSSPTLGAQKAELLKRYPAARWVEYEPVNSDNAYAGSKLAFGKPVCTHVDFEKADVVLSLDDDFLGSNPGNVRSTRGFASRRKPTIEDTDMNRLYVLETTPSLTGGKADHRLGLSPTELEQVAFYVAGKIGVKGPKVRLSPERRIWADELAKDLVRYGSGSVVVAGQFQPARIHALAHAMNVALGSAGEGVSYTACDPYDAGVHEEAMVELVGEMAAGNVDTLIILHANPIYDAPADLNFAEALLKVETSIDLGEHDDETAWATLWHIAASHPLEGWSDVRAADGTTTIMQPLIEPLYEGRSAHELLALLTQGRSRTDYDLVRDHWRSVWGEDGFEDRWRRAIHDGVVAGSRSRKLKPKLSSRLADSLVASASGLSGGRAHEDGTDAKGEFDLLIRPDSSVFDGRYANNGWLQELPRAVTKIVWDNAILIAASTADDLRVATGDIVKLTAGGRTIEGPLLVAPGQPKRTLTVHLGYGRSRVGRVGNGVGFDAYPHKTSSAPWHVGGATIERTGQTMELASTQNHHSMEGRHLIRSATLDEFVEDPLYVKHHEHVKVEGMSMFPDHEYNGYAWGMSIDLSACVGCNACTVACQAENNIPVVGKDQVAAGRVMQWIRVDRYFEGDIDSPTMEHQPVPCMHCERAPCEVVCPVNATVHSDEGLNDMVYNRCVGTRYCSNNCPYKVRRFNFYLYQDWETEPTKLQRNPDVSVRSRGVMEKCTYCTQRISHARIEAKREGRKIQDEDLAVACQQACPAGAIEFGDINNPEAAVSIAKADPRNYELLGELGTKPRTTYLGAVSNPNPAIVELEGGGKGHGNDSGHGGGHGHGSEGGAHG